MKACQKVGVAHRLAMAAFVTGAPRNTSWMKEDTKERFPAQEPVDKCYRICKMMASQGFIKAIDFDKPDNVQAEA